MNRVYTHCRVYQITTKCMPPNDIATELMTGERKLPEYVEPDDFSSATLDQYEN